jgi:peptide/nickel transport system permease protein
MARFTIRRLLASIPVLLLSSMLVFAMVANSGDPLGELRSRNPPVPAHVIEARRHQLQLDRSLPERSWQWMRHFVRGDMGQSITGLDVQPLLVRRMATTLHGVLSAVRQYTPSDYLLTSAGFLFLSMPTFWLAAVLKEFGAIRLNQLAGLPDGE